MSAQYTPLQLHPLSSATHFFQPHQELPDRVVHDSPAILVMTDFRQVTAVTIEPGVSIEWALQRMKEQDVHLLLVTNSRQQVVGLVTSTDIYGEKPMRLGNELRRPHSEITVREIMKSYDQLDVITMEDVLRAAVGDVMATLRRVGRRHALVLDRDSRSRRPMIRGMFSLSQISSQLGQPMADMVEVATTFADMEVALNG